MHGLNYPGQRPQTNADTLHLISLLFKDVQIQVKHKNELGKIFTADIESPRGDCDSPIWFIFYLHKALQTQELPSYRDKKDKMLHMITTTQKITKSL